MNPDIACQKKQRFGGYAESYELMGNLMHTLGRDVLSDISSENNKNFALTKDRTIFVSIRCHLNIIIISNYGPG